MVEARYAEGKPMVNCGIRIYSPENPEEEFQSGYTDANGNFVFYPDTGGKWKVEVDDGKGYKKVFDRNVFDKGIGVEVMYADGSLFTYSDAVVYCPDSDEEFQQGLTDKNGRFLFFPDREGDWELRVDDGMGHGIVAKITVGGDLKIKKRESGVGFKIWQKILIGISIIWGFTGIYFYFFTRKKLLKVQKK